MKNSDPTLLRILNKEPVSSMPVWLMRQAGRYLPEYRAIRQQSKSFIDLCLSADKACEITLQPVRFFDVDAAILFADILLVPLGLGQKVWFQEGEGPKLEPCDTLLWQKEKISAVYETIRLVKKQLAPEKTLIGFSGGLWTVACYMVQGESCHGFPLISQLIQKDREKLSSMMDVLAKATLDYLSEQIKAGVDCLQIFESHAGLLQGENFDRYIIKPTQKLTRALKEKHQGIKIIGFPRGAKEKELKAYVQKSGVDALSLGQDIDYSFAKKELQPLLPLQGMLDPELLLQGGDPMKKAAEKIFNFFGPQHIFNLGHGVIKETPPQHVKELVQFIRQLS